MSAVIGAPHIDTRQRAERSESVWRAAAKRFAKDRVGMVSLVIVACFLLLVAAAALGLVASGWQTETGVPNAPPGFVGPDAAAQNQAIVGPTGPNVDISAVEKRKRAACYAHASQSPDRYYAMQDEVARFRGVESGFQRAEAFVRQARSIPALLP